MKYWEFALFSMQYRSAHEYLEHRFSRPVRLFASVCFILLTCLYLAIVVYAPSLALSQVTGMQVVFLFRYKKNYL